MITADRGFIQFLSPDFGFWLLGSSDRGSQRSPEISYSLIHVPEKMTRNNDALKRNGFVMAVKKVASYSCGPSHLSDLWSKVNHHEPPVSFSCDQLSIVYFALMIQMNDRPNTTPIGQDRECFASFKCSCLCASL